MMGREVSKPVATPPPYDDLRPRTVHINPTIIACTNNLTADSIEKKKSTCTTTLQYKAKHTISLAPRPLIHQKRKAKRT
ncbi:hypothetical protein P167DRAFT_368472 [Morchella conica CCBAS932]|uniref:Uncharacterized protein n=1 Tax=Morchella conica CCBAS932 TaxID=1392247 RepID=A0A3N4KFG0_9PEZI|nr:hypothetical protein P167DRAFT_368472 [Morchella conica CCBAS932]